MSGLHYRDSAPDPECLECLRAEAPTRWRDQRGRGSRWPIYYAPAAITPEPRCAPTPLRPDVEARPAAGPTAGIRRRGTVLERLRRWFRTWPFDPTDLRS